MNIKKQHENEITKFIEKYSDDTMIHPMEIKLFYDMLCSKFPDENDQTRILNALYKTKTISKKIIINFQMQRQFENDTGLKYENNEYDFVVSYFNTKKYTFRSNGNINNYSAEIEKMKNLIETTDDCYLKLNYENEYRSLQIINPEIITPKEILNDLNKYVSKYKTILKFTENSIKSSLESFSCEQTRMKRNDTCLKIMGTIQDCHKKEMATDDEWDAFFDHVMPDDKTPNNLKRYVIKQWMWNVQAVAHNATNLSHPLMPIFYGVQGSGKSRLTNWLLKPLIDMHQETDLGQYLDDKNTDLKSNNLVLNIPEMAGHNRSEIEKLKSNMDSGYKSSRIMYSQSSQTTYYRAQLIGTSNTDVSEVIRDTTGNRRFFQFKVGRGQQYRINYDQFDPQRFWNSIKYNDEQPFENIDIHNEIKNIQNEQRKMDIYEQWFTHVFIEKPEYDCERYTTFETSETISTLYNDFSTYIENTISKVPVHSQPTFTTHIKDLAVQYGMKYESKKTTKCGRNATFVWVSK